MAEEMSKEDIESKIIDGTYDLVPEEKRHSKVWDTFSRIVDENQKLITDFAACSKCKKVYVCNHGSGTSNLVYFLLIGICHLVSNPVYSLFVLAGADVTAVSKWIRFRFFPYWTRGSVG